MYIDYRQQIVKNIALCINPLSKFKMDRDNNILIPLDEDSCKALLIANNIIDNFHKIFDINDYEITEIYSYLFNNNVLQGNSFQILNLLKMAGAHGNIIA